MTKKTPPQETYRVVRQDLVISHKRWSEEEFGFSLHTSIEQCMRYIETYQELNGCKNTPPRHEPSSKPYEVQVEKNEYEHVAETNLGIGFHDEMTSFLYEMTKYMGELKDELFEENLEKKIDGEILIRQDWKVHVFGQKSDLHGCTLHMTGEDRKKYTWQYQQRGLKTGRKRSLYPLGDSYGIEVPRELYERVEQSRLGIMLTPKQASTIKAKEHGGRW